MDQNYWKIAWRNTIKNKISSLINVLGLAVGMAVAIVIGLWVYDEMTFNNYHAHHRQIAQVMQNVTVNGVIKTSELTPIPLGNELRRLYGSDFTHVVTSTGIHSSVLSYGEKVLTEQGGFFEPDAPAMLSLRMVSGTAEGLKNTGSILLSQSAANAFFGDMDPINKVMLIDDTMSVAVRGVYEDLPKNSDFSEMQFMSSWDLYVSYYEQKRRSDWDFNSFNTYVQLADNTDMETVSEKIRDIKMDKVNKGVQKYQPKMFLNPMDKWHLYSDFKNGVREGLRARTVWLFGMIGAFVLLMACINFMNLATARSEKRAREVGIRKTLGSSRIQLVRQFFSESVLVAMISFLISIILALLFLPFINQVSDKQMSIPWTNPIFWIACIGCCWLTGLIAGSYPALYLSSFRPVTVLKGTYKTGSLAALPRKILVVLQFTISIAMIIGVFIVFRQVQYARHRSLGYNPGNLIIVRTQTPHIHDHFDAVRDELQQSGAILQMAESHSPLTAVFLTIGGFDWQGKNPEIQANFNTLKVSYDFGKTVGWKIKEGRDFSRDFASDSLRMILNEAAVKFMGLEHPVGTVVTQQDYLKGYPYTVIGVVDDMLMESPYKAIMPSVYIINPKKGNFAILKLNPSMDREASLNKIETVFRKYNPTSPFDFQYVSDQYDLKFGDERRTEKLAGFFTILAIVISCLGIFGLASFVAEQRIKEIGIRKLLGANRLYLWSLLSKDFVWLVIISFCVATPASYFLMHKWLLGFEYRYTMHWAVFAGAGIITMLITLITVSFQTMKAASVNPVKSLRAE